MKTHTILGSGGAIGIELARALKEYPVDIRLVSRNPVKVNESDEIFPADLMEADAVRRAIKGSDVAYVTLGFQYKYKVWKKNWPLFISRVIDACIEEKCKLVFFDNIYMYDPYFLNGMDEETPIKPVSKKGLIRKEIAAMIMDQVREGKLEALIARSADFYGPGVKMNSMLSQTVIEPLSKGKKANWFCSVDYKHSFTYTPDAGKATAILGNTPEAFNQVWHLPTATDPLTGKEWIDAFSSAFGVKPKYQLAGPFLMNILGLFNPVMKEFPEMMYQYNRHYVFNSDKFMKQFNFKPTSYDEGIKQILKSDYALDS